MRDNGTVISDIEDQSIHSDQLQSVSKMILLSSNCAADMFEERALLLSRIGHHEVALAIYVHVLNDQTMAEE